MSNVLVIAEHEHGHLRKVNWSVLSFAKKAAAITGGEVIVALLGAGLGDAAKQVAQFDVAKVIVVDDSTLENYLTGEFASAVAGVAENADARIVCTVASLRGKDFMPRVAVKLEAGMISDVMDVMEEDDELLFKRPVWSGKLTEVLQATTDIICATVRHTEFDAMEPTGAGAEIEAGSPDIEGDGAEFVSFDAIISERPELSDANVIIAGGRGMKSREGFAQLEAFADLFGGAVGATRAAVDSGMCPNDWQIGQTGKVVAPDLYFAIAISGAIQHLAGMKGSKTIIAINKDPEAPIFQVADYGLVGDAFKILPELHAAVEAAKG